MEVELITYDELCDAIEKDTSKSEMRTKAEFLEWALNDYPEFNLQEPVDLIRTLKNEIGMPLTYENIKNYCSKLSFQEAFKHEALFEILEMMSFDKTKTLEETVIEISQHYKSQVDTK